MLLRSKPIVLCKTHILILFYSPETNNSNYSWSLFLLVYAWNLHGFIHPFCSCTTHVPYSSHLDHPQNLSELPQTHPHRHLTCTSTYLHYLQRLHQPLADAWILWPFIPVAPTYMMREQHLQFHKQIRRSIAAGDSVTI